MLLSFDFFCILESCSATEMSSFWRTSDFFFTWLNTDFWVIPCKTLLSFGVFFLPSYRLSRCFRLALNCLLLSSLRSVKTLRTFVGVNSYASPSPDSSCEEDSEVTTLLFYICMSMRSCLLKRIWCISSTFCPLVRSELTLKAFFSFTMILLRYRSRFDGPYFKLLFCLQCLQLRKYLKRCLREYSKLRRFMIVL